MMKTNYLLSLVTTLTVPIANIAFAANVDLPSTVRTALQSEIAPACRDGNSLAALKKLTSLLPRLSDSQLTAVDAWLEEHHLPKADALIVDTRLALVQHNQTQQLPKPNAREVALIVPEIERRIERTLTDAQKHPAMVRPLPRPESLMGYEKPLYDLDMLARQVETAVRSSQYGQQVFESAATRGANAKTTRSSSLVTQMMQLAQCKVQVEEQQLAWRLQRLDRAGDVLKNGDDSKERFLAAGVLDEDGTALFEYFSQAENSKRRHALPELNAPGLATVVKTKLDAGRVKAGPLVQKSRQLQAGLQWWLRGRYGRGTEGFGLLKSEWALGSVDAQMSLFMPPETPLPTESSDRTAVSVPYFDRRHHYIWMFEYRQVLTSTQDGFTSSGAVTMSNNPNGLKVGADKYAHVVVSRWTTVNKSLTPSDNRQVARLVGFLEYGQSLSKLDDLVNAASKEELEAFDALVAARPEFAVYTNLSRRLEKGQSTLREPANEEGKFERRGLRWVTALARIEFGAMLAAFTSVPNPFENIANVNFDQAEYRNLLLDGARVHYWALYNDPALRNVLQNAPLGSQMLSYSRRLKLARALLSTAARQEQYTPMQQQELKTWYDQLAAIDERLVGIIRRTLQSQTSNTGEFAGGIHLYSHMMPSGPVKVGSTFANWPFTTVGALQRDVIRAAGP